MGRNYRILLVEDDDNDVIMMFQLLESIMHHDVVVARDGTEAICLAQGNIFDLVLLDIRLPGMSGAEVATTLRQIEACRDVPIICITAYDLADRREHCLRAGCTEYLVKPIDIDSFIQLVSEYLAPTG